MKTHSFKLKNGLQVILVPSHKAPVVSVQCWVRTGSADESKGNEGISHFIEHLVFKGSRDFGPGEIANVVEAGGGELNAYTSFDQTVFYVTISAPQANTALQVVSQMMGFPLFDPREIDSEREVVVEEIKRGQDSFSRRGSELLFSTHYKAHPYGRPVIGYEKNIRKWSADHIRDYYKKRYSPRNMFLLVTGDFEIQKMKREVARFFAPIPAQKTPKTPKISWNPPKKGQQKIQGSSFQQRLVYLVWPGPRVQHKDVPGLDVLMMILGQGDSSRLVRHLRLERPLVQSVGASCYSPLEPGLLMISLVPQPELLPEALQQLQHEILKIRHEPVSLAELQKAVRALETDDLMSQESVEGLARKFGSLEFYLRDLKAQDKYLKALRQLTPLQLQKLAQKYLDPQQMSRIALVPESEKKSTDQALSRFTRSLSKSDQNVGTQRAPSQKPRWDRIVRTRLSSHPNEVQSLLINGVRVFLKKTSESSLVSVRASFLGGSRLDKLPELGRTEVLGRTWLGGTSKRTEHEIAEISESFASSLYPVVGRNTIGLALDVLSSHERKLGELFFDCLCDPAWPKEIFQRERDLLIEQLKSRRDQPAQVAFIKAAEALFPDHPYGFDTLGNERSLKSLHTSSLQNLWSQVAQRKNLSLTICGNFDRKFWIDTLEERVQALPSGSALDLQNIPTKLAAPVSIFEKNPKAQSHVVMSYRGLSLNDPERDTLQVLQSLLAGQGGRLFIELRDKASLAYTVAPVKMEGLETGSFGAYIGCSPEKVLKAIEMMKAEFQKLMQTPVPDVELERSKRYLMGRSAIDLQKNPAQANAVHYAGIYGLDPMDAFQFPERLQKVSAGQVMSLAKKIFSGPYVLSVVGPEDPWSSN